MTPITKTPFVNNVRLTVRLGTKPELLKSASGRLWAKARVALSMGKDKTGHGYKPSLWLTAKAFTRQDDARLPEALAALPKGALVTVLGRLAYEEYVAANGERRSELAVLVDACEPVADAGEPVAGATEPTPVANGAEAFDPPADDEPY